MIRPIRDGAGLFHEEPEDLASGIEAHGLKLIEHGRRGVPMGVLPYLEEEAIARLRHAVGPLGESEAAWKRENWEWWRQQWVQVAHSFLGTSKQGPIDATRAWCAAEILTRTSELRHAIDAGQAEKAAALGMVVASWVSMGGVSVRLSSAEPLATRHRAAQRAKAEKDRTTVQTDGEKLRKRDLVKQALSAAGGAAGTGEVWGHLVGVLERIGLSPVESGCKDGRELRAVDGDGKLVRFTFKGVQTMLRTLRTADAPSKRGRPRK